MATINSFESRLDDMYNARTPNSLKRKSINTYSTPSRPELSGPESRLLSPFDKRMKIAQWDAVPRTNARTNLFPNSVRPVLDTISSRDFPLTRQFPPRPVPSAGRVLHKGTVTESWTSLMPEIPGRVFSKPLDVPSTVSSVFYTHEGESYSRGYSDLVKENVALRWQLKQHEEFSRGAIEFAERRHAMDLKSEAQVEAFKKKVHSSPTSGSRLNEAWPAQGYKDARIQESSLLPSNHSRAVSRSSAARNVAYSAREVSHSGYLSDDEIFVSGNKDGDGKQVTRPGWKEMWENCHEPSWIEQREYLDKEIEFALTKLQALQLGRPSKLRTEKKVEEDKTLEGAFNPLSDEAEHEVDKALGGGDRFEVLAAHEKSNIDVTRVVMQCLLPGAWLNDEVINVYMELLKEREMREPSRFLKCHFFNTFFYNKLYKDKRSYDYKAIRRWTTPRKLGYSLSDCDKILVPIHQDIHWCLAVINIRDKKLEYLDSLKGGDRAVLDVLARYIADEAKDKDSKVFDVSDWEHNFPKEIPEQLNGCDCGMFMVKYADFHSRGAPLQFTQVLLTPQEHMEYFRRKMVCEILQLRAT